MDKFLKEFIEYAKAEFNYDVKLYPKSMSAEEIMETMFGDILHFGVSHEDFSIINGRLLR